MTKSEWHKKNREQNREKLINYSKEYYKNNREKLIKQQAGNKWYHENLIKAKKTRADYFQKNKEKIKQRRRERYATDLNYKIAVKLRSRFGSELRKYKNGMAYKKESIMDLIGCSIPDLIKYLENKFLPGMTWENHGLWHIDHIIPCSKFNLTLDKERVQCFHHTNLQPLWAEDNISKGCKYVTPILPD